jgi:DNA-binding CsgD family transcriptional regulator/tetratricopeptide (TPR) repeat protein
LILLLKGLESSYNASYSNSIVILLEAAKIFEEKNQSANLAKAYQSLAFDFHQLGDFESQESYLLKQIEIDKALGNSLTLIQAYNNLGVSYNKRDALDKALFYYELAYQELTFLKNPFLTAQNLTNRANIFEKSGDYPTAERLFLACEQLSAQHEITYGVLLSNLNLGNLYRMMEKYSLSESHLNTALSLAKSLKLKKEEALVFERVAWLERDRGAFKKAYEYLFRYYTLNDSLVNESVRNTANELKMKYEAEKKENEIISLSNDKLYQQYFMALMGFVLVVLLLIIYWWKNKNQLVQVKLELSENLIQVKEEVLKLREKDLLQQTMEKVALKEQMQALVKRFKEENSHKNIENQVREIEFKQKPWDDMLEKFKLIHPEFIEKLSKSFPQLTQNEFELCSLIKMNLTTKEIARILRITDQSVRTKKYRLLKKLNLSNETDLVTWVNKFAAK